MSFDVTDIAQSLIRCPSVTPKDAGALDVLQQALESLGFECHRLPFTEDGTPDVDNLYARRGGGGKHLCFAGHTDVVPVGDESAWSVDPFAAEVKDGILTGRGAVDMKGAIAAWVAAIAEAGDVDGSLSLLITGDEEGPAINGTRKMLDWLAERGEQIDACIVGEPTNPTQLGEMIKIGRRGSVRFYLTVEGTQGHVAYPDAAHNPVTELVNICQALKGHTLDEGTAHFQPSNLEVVTIDVGNEAENVIPAKANAVINIRFNDTHSSESLTQWVDGICAKHARDYLLRTHVTGEAFLTEPGPLSELVANAVEDVTGRLPELSTTGGTSDARFIKDICPVVECGLINATAHQVDERIAVSDLEDLTQIYRRIITGFFA